MTNDNQRNKVIEQKHRGMKKDKKGKEPEKDGGREGWNEGQ